MKRLVIFVFMPFFGAIQATTSLAQCGGLDIDLGPDTVLCPGQNIQVSISSNIDNVHWNDGSNAFSRTLNTPGTYSVSGESIGSNLVINGDFEAGNTGFTSDYVTGSSSGGGSWGLLSWEGTYEVTTSPDLVHYNFFPCTYQNNMLVVNGASNPNSNVWCQNISVTPGTEYLFSTDVSNALYDPTVANLQFSINGTQLGGVFSTSPNGCDWLTFSETWASGSTTSAQICILNQNTSVGGNDFALDNIYFAPLCSFSDTVVISPPVPISYSLGNDTSLCFGSGNSLVYDLSASPLYFLDATGNTSENYVINGPGTYTVNVSDGCTQANDQITIGGLLSPSLVYITPEILLCELQGVPITAQFSNPGPITWTLNGALIADTSSSILVNPVATETEICVQSSGACGSASACTSITMDEVHADFNMTPIPGEKGAVQVVDASSTKTQFINWQWLAPESEEISSIVPSPIFHFGEIQESSITLIVESAIGCVDTTTKSFKIPGPVYVYVPNTFTPDGNKYNNTWYYIMDGIVEGSFKMEIFDRWGEKIWSCSDPRLYWDGRYKENEVASGTYNWVLYYQLDPKEDPIVRTGHVSVLR